MAFDETILLRIQAQLSPAFSTSVQNAATALSEFEDKIKGLSDVSKNIKTISTSLNTISESAPAAAKQLPSVAKGMKKIADAAANAGDVQNFGKGMKDIAKAVATIGIEAEKVSDRLKGVENSVDGVASKASGIVGAVENINAGNKDLQKQVDLTTRALNTNASSLSANQKKMNAVAKESGILTKKLREQREQISAVNLRWLDGLEGITRLLKAQIRYGINLAAIGAVTKTVRGAFRRFIDTQEQTRRVMTALLGDVQDLEAAGKRLSKELTKASSKLGLAINDVADAQFELASSGIGLQATIDGLIPVLNLAVGAEAELTETTRATVGIYRTFGDELAGVSTQQEKFVRISDVLAKTFQFSSVSLNELVDGIKFSGAQANAAGIDLELLTSSLSVLNDNLLRGSQAGTGMGQVMTQMISKSSDLKAAFGQAFQVGDTDSFLDTLEAIRGKILSTDQTIRQSSLEDLGRIFDKRGARAAAVLAQNVELLRQRFEQTKNGSEGMAAAIAKIRLDNFAAQLRITTESFLNLLGSGVGPLVEKLTPIVALLGYIAQGLTEANEATKGWLGTISLLTIGFVALDKAIKAALVSETVGKIALFNNAILASGRTVNTAGVAVVSFAGKLRFLGTVLKSLFLNPIGLAIAALAAFALAFKWVIDANDRYIEKTQATIRALADEKAALENRVQLLERIRKSVDAGNQVELRQTKALLEREEAVRKTIAANADAGNSLDDIIAKLEEQTQKEIRINEYRERVSRQRLFKGQEKELFDLAEALEFNIKALEGVSEQNALERLKKGLDDLGASGVVFVGLTTLAARLGEGLGFSERALADFAERLGINIPYLANTEEQIAKLLTQLGDKSPEQIQKFIDSYKGIEGLRNAFGDRGDEVVAAIQEILNKRKEEVKADEDSAASKLRLAELLGLQAEANKMVAASLDVYNQAVLTSRDAEIDRQAAITALNAGTERERIQITADAERQKTQIRLEALRQEQQISTQAIAIARQKGDEQELLERQLLKTQEDFARQRLLLERTQAEALTDAEGQDRQKLIEKQKAEERRLDLEEAQAKIKVAEDTLSAQKSLLDKRVQAEQQAIQNLIQAERNLEAARRNTENVARDARLRRLDEEDRFLQIQKEIEGQLQEVSRRTLIEPGGAEKAQAAIAEASRLLGMLPDEARDASGAIVVSQEESAKAQEELALQIAETQERLARFQRDNAEDAARESSAQVEAVKGNISDIEQRLKGLNQALQAAVEQLNTEIGRLLLELTPGLNANVNAMESIDRAARAAWGDVTQGNIDATTKKIREQIDAIQDLRRAQGYSGYTEGIFGMGDQLPPERFGSIIPRSGPYYLHKKEVVMPPEATAFYGDMFMNRLRRMEIPRSAVNPWVRPDGETGFGSGKQVVFNLNPEGVRQLKDMTEQEIRAVFEKAARVYAKDERAKGRAVN